MVPILPLICVAAQTSKDQGSGRSEDTPKKWGIKGYAGPKEMSCLTDPIKSS